MIFYKKHKAFTMIELIFVIVVIGILSAIAIPKFAATRSDAEISKAKATVAAIRNAVSTQRQQLILRGNFNPVTSLNIASSKGYDKPIFDGINGEKSHSTLEYPLQSCKDNKAQACWYTGNNITYTYILPVSGKVDFNLTNNRFNCKLPLSDNCKLLTF